MQTKEWVNQVFGKEKRIQEQNKADKEAKVIEKIMPEQKEKAKR